MKALALTTRYRQGQFEAEACLLVYDDTTLSGSAIGDDVRDVLERRPNTPRIYVVAPFLADATAKSALLEGSALRRAGVINMSTAAEVWMLAINVDTGVSKVVCTRFDILDGNAVEGSQEDLPAALREGWLFHLFDSFEGLVNAPIGVHFGKTSGKHSSKFLRASNVLLSTAACGLIAFLGLCAVRRFEPRRIFVDTAPLLAVALAMQRVASIRGLWTSFPPIKSFSSYGGLNKLPRLSTTDLVLISASTSGGLAAILLSEGLASDMLLTIFFLKSGVNVASDGAVLCDLTFQPARTFGYQPIDNYSGGQCELCKKGYILAELEGDQFLLERRAVKRLRVGVASQSPDAKSALEKMARFDALKVRLHKHDTRRSDIDIDLTKFLGPGGFLCDDYARLLMRFTPTPLDFVVVVGMSIERADQYLTHAGLSAAVHGAQLVEGGYVGNLIPKTGGNALVIIGSLSDHSLLRGINAQLRPKIDGGCVAYIAALTIADSARALADLRIFLSFGDHGPDSFTFKSALDVMLPWTGEEVSPWVKELQLWQKLKNEGLLPVSMGVREQWLATTASASSKLFLPGSNGELALTPDFVFLNTKDNLVAVSQADVYAVVCNALATARCDNVGISAQVQRASPTPTWGQSVFAQSVICPSNFRDFNDPVLRAAFLRAARAQELNYAVDDACSEEMYQVIRTDVESWTECKGESLPEFLLSLACGRLRLLPNHVISLKSAIALAGLPSDLGALASQIPNA